MSNTFRKDRNGEKYKEGLKKKEARYRCTCHYCVGVDRNKLIDKIAKKEMKEEIKSILDFDNYLADKFIKEEDCLYKSKKKWIGAGTGDDSTLYVYLDENITHLWWRENRGYENTIFYGRAIKSQEELEQLFDLLELKIYLKW